MDQDPTAELVGHGETILKIRNRILAGEEPSIDDLDDCWTAVSALERSPHTNGIDWLVRMCFEGKEILEKFGPKSTRDMERQARRRGLVAPRSDASPEALRKAAALS